MEGFEVNRSKIALRHCYETDVQPPRKLWYSGGCFFFGVGVLDRVAIKNHAENEEGEKGNVSQTKASIANPQLLIINY